MVIFLLTGCGYVQGYLNMMKDRGLSEEYARSLRTWTRDMTAHSQFETKFYISATYRSPAFNEAYLKEKARVRQWQSEETKKQEEMWRQASADYREFLVYVYTDKLDANDLAGRTSIWSVSLTDAGKRRHEPLEIRKYDRITAETEAFFPFINKYYGKCYIIKFPASEEKRDMRMIFSSVLGRVDLEWKAGDLK